MTRDAVRRDRREASPGRSQLGDTLRHVSAEQIEAVALENRAILECAAIAVPSPFGEDDIKVCVKLVPGATATVREIAASLVSALPKAMAVRYVELFTELPKTQTEKVKQAVLRQMGERGLTPETWDHEQGRFVGGPHQHEEEHS